MKRFMTVIVVLAVALAARAQRAKGTVTIYPRVGVNWAELANADIYDGADPDGRKVSADNKAGFTAGVEAQYQFAANTALSAGVFYSAQGAEWEFKDMDLKTTLHYINVPLTAVQYLGNSGFAVRAGVQFGYLADSKDKPSGRGVEGSSGTSKDAYKKFDFSVPVGISYEYKNVVLDLRYNIGVTKVYKHIDAGKNRSLMLTLGYGFDI